MNKIQNRKLLHQLTSHLLEQRGYPKSSSDYDIEWDAKEPDSQYSMCYEDVEIVVNYLNELGYDLVKRHSFPTPSVTYTSSAYVSTTGNVRIK